jgi:selenocysteine-specific elongation factor
LVTMYVVGTAGHVDHGKSTLVKALTGIDPDRLKEEKEREMTIDLGFAWLRLPSGNEVSIIDVPGHERFVNNMLAGVGGIDLALLIVAADESVMTQTREHLAILDLIQIRQGLVVITKKDLVDADWLELVAADVEDAVKGTVMEGARIIPVSALTGEGLPELVAAIDGLLQQAPPKKDVGRPRLPIDRSFTIAGFGTVVTGTLIDGSLSVGQEVELVPAGRTTRIRGLQTHRTKVEKAAPGSRVAANLSGISHEEIARGEVLTIPGWLRPTTAMDVRLRVIPGAPNPVRHNMFVTVHTGSSEAVARIRLLGIIGAHSSAPLQAEPGETTWAQLKLEAPLAVVKGDYFVIRSSEATLGGGNIVDPHARRHQRVGAHGRAPLLERLEVMQAGTDRDVLLKSIEMAEPADFKALVARANLDPSAAQAELEAMASEGLVVALGRGMRDEGRGRGESLVPGIFIYTASGWSSVAQKARDILDAYHRQFPLRKGFPKEELRSRLGMTQQVFNHALPRLQADGAVVEEGALVKLPNHQPRLSPSQEKAAQDYIRLLESEPYSPPTDSPIDPEVLEFLAAEGKVVKVSETVVFSASAYRDMVDKISEYIREKGEVTVGDVRDMFNTSRKYALVLMDYLDQQRITRRVGDVRVLR